MPGSTSNIGRLAHGHVGVNDGNHRAWDGTALPIGKHPATSSSCTRWHVELGLENPTKLELERAMAGHVLGEAALVGTYKRRVKLEVNRARRAP